VQYSYNKATGTSGECTTRLSERRVKDCKLQKRQHLRCDLDLRTTSSTYLRWSAVTLDSARRNMLYVPEGFAHGFQTLEDDTEVLYKWSTSYAPEWQEVSAGAIPFLT